MKQYYRIRIWKWNGKEYEPSILLDTRFFENPTMEDIYNTEKQTRKNFNRVKLSKDIVQKELVTYEYDESNDFEMEEQSILLEEF
jgi:hypothetical protein